MTSSDTHAERLRCLAVVNSIVKAAIMRPGGTLEETARLLMLGIDLQAAIATGRGDTDTTVARGLLEEAEAESVAIKARMS